jgi:hypothetical protein
VTDQEPLTEDECEVAFDLWLCRMNGLAGALKPECYPAAYTLSERGWLSRRIQDDDVIWEFTDEGLAALDLNSLNRTDPADMN